MKKVNVFFIAFLIAFVFTSFSRKESDKVHWLSIEEMQLAYKRSMNQLWLQIHLYR